jgi:NADH:ubiquinone reductase (non-electrogenic)
MEPIRNFLRHKKAQVKYYEAEATKIDYERRVVYISDDSDIKGDVSQTEVPFDMLVVGVGAENATFGASFADLYLYGANVGQVFPVSRRTASF